MQQKIIGNFNVWMMGDGYSTEAVLLTHGGYSANNGVASLGSSVYFYAPHTWSIYFTDAWDVIKGGKKMEVSSIAGAESSIWNYGLEKLSDDFVPSLGASQYDGTMDAWTERPKNLTPWDWWEARDNTNVAALATAFKTAGHQYDKVYFLCCRAWMDPKAPAPFGKVGPQKDTRPSH